MSKVIARKAKIEFEGGSAKPGAKLASLGINMPQFCTKFNSATQDRKGEIVPVEIIAYKDKSFDFVLKTTPTSILLKKAAGIKKGSSNADKLDGGEIALAEIKKIAEYKLPDLNTKDIDQAIKIVCGCARSLGLVVKE